jgi:hypothetical protein
MTDTTITQGFIEMVKAYEAKPALEKTIADLRQDVEFFERNLRIEEDTTSNLRNRNAELEAKLSEVTTQRDDAMFRSLELEEKLGGIERLLGMAERVESARKAEHEATVAAMTPKPVELAEVEQKIMEEHPVWNPTGPIDPVVIEPQGQSEVDPMPVGQPENDTTTSKDGPETQTVFDPYKNESWLNQPYDNKPWWVKDPEWNIAGGLMF